MAERDAIEQIDWLAALRRMVAAQRELFAADSSIAGRTVYEGIGEGGDRTLELDRRCEDAVFAELERLHDESDLPFIAVSEERGQVSFGGDEAAAWVVIDPIDGSLNARRTIPAHALSVAVASGPTMADCELGFVHDFGPDEEYFARRGRGATLDGRPVEARGPGYGLEVVGIESADPGVIAPVVAGLAGEAYRVRVIGSIAITLCYVAVGRLDAMVSVRPCRSVDAAAAQLIAREAGAVVEFEDDGLDGATLDLDARYRVAAALEPGMLATVRGAQELAGEPR